ncbi:vault protein inter-alpha-trypsin domain-containing protein [Mycena leptocephala]|nr:vault protein inter-alpha-trypsin domain-containing protein [Mycena leptocephala]
MPIYHAIPIYGLYYYHQHQCFPAFAGGAAEASIKELAAQVKLTQTYGNDATFPIEAKYSFPIPARASVVGSVLEKQEARETYETAVAQGQQASLVEQQTADVFQVSVGNIPSNEQVQIELVYATELSEDEELILSASTFLFTLARYGKHPKRRNRRPLLQRNRRSYRTHLQDRVPFAYRLHRIGTRPKLPNFKELPFSNYARVSLSSDSPWIKIFLAIKSAGLDTPRCVAELHPTHDTVAMGLTLVPRFKLPDLNRQEFVFMVDRSGSMRHQRIEAAKKALIVSFGNRSTSLWPQGSKPYNQQTLEEATPLLQCAQTGSADEVLVLTDGDAWDLDGVLSEVKSAVAKAPKNAFLRVSVLGIGNSASTAMCEGMARVGNGTCMMVGEEETTFTGKIARMLKAANVDWGRPAAKEKQKEKVVSPPDYDDEFEIVEPTSEKKKTLNIFDESIEDPIEVTGTVPDPEYLPQYPSKCICHLTRQNHPQTVTLRGTIVDGAEIELPVPVVLAHLPNVTGAPPAIHTLAARKIVQDLEDGQHALIKTLKNPDDTDLLARTVKASIIRLGKTYSIASSHTSFVAVDDSTPPSKPEAFPAVPNAFMLAHPSKLSCRVPLTVGGGGAQQPLPAFKAMKRSAARPSLGLGGAVQAMGNFTATVGTVMGPSAAHVSARRPSSSVLDGGKRTRTVRPPPPPIMASDPLEALARLQSFDGCFSLEVLSVVKLKSDIQAVRKAFPAGATDAMVATVLAMAFLATKLGASVDRDSWEGIYEKAQQYVEAALQSMGATETTDVLEGKVAQLLA